MFKVGDLVKIVKVDFEACPVYKFNDKMKALKGKEARIVEAYPFAHFYRIDLDSGRWKWEEGCFKKLPKEWD